VNSMSDLFHEGVPDDFIMRVFAIMCKARHHIFQVLTKRAERMLAWTGEHFRFSVSSTNGKALWPSHVWLGVSIENQDYTRRIQYLQQTPAHVRFLSIEPMLGPISFDSSMVEGIHWVIVGGESGPAARPMKSEWVRDVRAKCEESRIPFFFKQWGTYDCAGGRVGKIAAGRLLDGKIWDQTPLSIPPISIGSLI